MRGVCRGWVSLSQLLHHPVFCLKCSHCAFQTYTHSLTEYQLPKLTAGISGFGNGLYHQRRSLVLAVISEHQQGQQKCLQIQADELKSVFCRESNVGFAMAERLKSLYYFLNKGLHSSSCGAMLTKCFIILINWNILCHCPGGLTKSLTGNCVFLETLNSAPCCSINRSVNSWSCTQLRNAPNTWWVTQFKWYLQICR